MNDNDWIATIGVTLILAAFFCSTFKIIKTESKIYYLLNFIGAGLACFASWLITFWPFVVLEGIWAIVSLVGFVKLFTNGDRTIHSYKP